MSKNILIKPVVSEKSEGLSDGQQQYTFIVEKTANKIEVRNAVEARYGVTVERVNTLTMPGKTKNRSTKSGLIRGRVPAFKKAIVTLADGEELDLYNEA
ncbi:MAG: 50S ribosomal protein L23 [Bacteroidota bacterium]